MASGGPSTGGPGSVGRRYEDVAAAFLAAQGLVVIARNVEAGGVELDAVARAPDGTVVFVEVRARARGDRGLPEETVGPAKRRRLARGAAAYLAAEGLWGRVPVRFDVVACEGPVPDDPSALAFAAVDRAAGRFEARAKDGPVLTLRWYPNAFGSD